MTKLNSKNVRVCNLEELDAARGGISAAQLGCYADRAGWSLGQGLGEGAVGAFMGAWAGPIGAAGLGTVGAIQGAGLGYEFANTSPDCREWIRQESAAGPVSLTVGDPMGVGVEAWTE